MFTQPFHVFDSPNACLSEGGALAVVVQAVPGNPHWTQFGTDCQVRCGNPPCGAAPGCPHLARRVVAPHGRGGSGGSDPRFLTASAAPGRVSRFTSQFTVNPPLGVAPSTMIPRGKAIEYCRGQGRSTDRSSPRLPPAREPAQSSMSRRRRSNRSERRQAASIRPRTLRRAPDRGIGL